MVARRADLQDAARPPGHVRGHPDRGVRAESPDVADAGRPRLRRDADVAVLPEALPRPAPLGDHAREQQPLGDTAPTERPRVRRRSARRHARPREPVPARVQAQELGADEGRVEPLAAARADLPLVASARHRSRRSRRARRLAPRRGDRARRERRRDQGQDVVVDPRSASSRRCTGSSSSRRDRRRAAPSRRSRARRTSATRRRARRRTRCRSTPPRSASATSRRATRASSVTTSTTSGRSTRTTSASTRAPTSSPRAPER